MNKILTLSIILAIGAIMLTSTTAPALADKDNNNGKAKGCEKANDNSKVREKNPNCVVFIICEAFGETSSSLRLFFDTHSTQFQNQFVITSENWPGTDAQFDEINRNGDTHLTFSEVDAYWFENCPKSF